MNNRATSPTSSTSSSLKRSTHNPSGNSMVSPCSPTSSLLSTSPMSPWSALGIVPDHSSNNSNNLLSVGNSNIPSSRSMPNSPGSFFPNGSGPNSPINLGARLIGTKQASIDETALKSLVLENMKHFTIVFDAFMNVGGDFLEAFREFLQYERNSAPLEFLQLIPTYREISNSNERYQQAKYIVETFVDDSLTSDKQLNLPNALKDQIVNQFEDECTPSNTPTNLFDQAMTEVTISLKTDSFSRFITSNQFISYSVNHVKKELPNIVGSTNVESVKKCLVSLFSSVGTRNNRRSRIQSLSMTSSFSLSAPQFTHSHSCPTNHAEVISDIISHSTDNEPVLIKDRFEELLRERDNKNIDERFFDVFHELLWLKSDAWKVLSQNEEYSSFESEQRFSTGSQIEQPDESFENLRMAESHPNFFNSELGSKKVSNLSSSQYKFNATQINAQKVQTSSSKKKKNKPNGKKLIKEVGIVNGTTDELLDALLDTRYSQIIDPNLKDCKFIEYIKNDEYSVSYQKEVHKLMWPLSKREYCIGTTVRREINEDGTESRDYVIIKKSIDNKDAPLEKGNVKGQILGGILLEEIDANFVKYTSIFYNDFGGKVPRALRNKVLSSRGQAFYNGLTKTITSRRRLTNIQLTSEQTNRQIDTLNDFTERARRVSSIGEAFE
ncbi:predicted protein [Naegleria gruberi]|uniref:Predicted protein n=1 Tax=Naegleria gruberi TaxID=5762 RepID=D2VTP8_NAEGR|nr:uncharacterized protein NAEGRDRAFT_72378 [Naegleria gruberi]EFC39762.1 predicted protein [Naegleria gruberi]|eukprot:XP_002672506.1 predicted protein [Naegleria gruberi strain NEG-M]